jgi:hypothetical protein
LLGDLLLLNALLHIQHKIHFGGWVELEFFDHQLAGASGAAPVDAVEAIAGLVIADGRDVRRDVVGAAFDVLAAG